MITENTNQKEYCLVNTETGAVEKQNIPLNENIVKEQNYNYALNNSSLKWVEVLKG